MAGLLSVFRDSLRIDPRDNAYGIAQIAPRKKTVARIRPQCPIPASEVYRDTILATDDNTRSLIFFFSGAWMHHGFLTFRPRCLACLDPQNEIVITGGSFAFGRSHLHSFPTPRCARGQEVYHVTTVTQNQRSSAHGMKQRSCRQFASGFLSI